MGDSSFRRHGLHNWAFCGERKMPWKVCKPMDERLKFIARLLDGEQMAPLCREFGISRKTGYKILTRYRAIGLDGLTDRSRRPYRHANQLPVQIETLIVRLKNWRISSETTTSVGPRVAISYGSRWSYIRTQGSRRSCVPSRAPRCRSRTSS